MQSAGCLVEVVVGVPANSDRPHHRSGPHFVRTGPCQIQPAGFLDALDHEDHSYNGDICPLLHLVADVRWRAPTLLVASHDPSCH